MIKHIIPGVHTYFLLLATMLAGPGQANSSSFLWVAPKTKHMPGERRNTDRPTTNTRHNVLLVLPQPGVGDARR
uniref:Putative secreted protein n=1 Tax=Anopheles darlingi TaxID=43151 RepID=A0A2M4DMU5_ANODA